MRACRSSRIDVVHRELELGRRDRAGVEVVADAEMQSRCEPLADRDLVNGAGVGDPARDKAGAVQGGTDLSVDGGGVAEVGEAVGGQRVGVQHREVLDPGHPAERPQLRGRGIEDVQLGVGRAAVGDEPLERGRAAFGTGHRGDDDSADDSDQQGQRQCTPPAPSELVPREHENCCHITTMRLRCHEDKAASPPDVGG